MDWTSAFKLGASMWANGITAFEILLAANNVVGKRGQTIDAAIRDPLGADLQEARWCPRKSQPLARRETPSRGI